MKIFDILNEAPASQMYAKATPGISNDDMAAGKFSDMVKTKRDQKLVQKQADTNKEKSKQSGIMGQIGKERSQESALQNLVVPAPNGLFYQYIETGKGKKGWQWQELDPASGKLKNIKKPTAMDPQKKMAGTYPLKDTDSLSMNITQIAKGLKPQKKFWDKVKGWVKDKAVDAIGGPLASKTMTDPDASTAQKVGAVAGAALGRLAAKTIGSGGEAPAPLKDPTKIATMDLNAFQKRILDKNKSAEEKKQLAQEFLAQMQQQQSKGVDVDKYVNSLGPIMKATGLNKEDPAFYADFVKQARGMRREAYEYLNKVLEITGITWEQLGFKVVLSESKSDDVLLLPIQALTEAIEIQNLKLLAGV